MQRKMLEDYTWGMWSMTTKVKYVETLQSGQMIWSEYFIKNHNPHKVGDIVDGFEVTKVDQRDPMVYHIKDVRGADER